MKIMNKNDQTDDFEGAFDFLFVIDYLISAWKYVFAGAFFGFVGSIMYLTLSPKIYEGNAVLQVARAVGSEVEPPQQLLEKLKFPSYFAETDINACRVSEKNSLPNLSSRLSVKLLKGTSYLQLTYRDTLPTRVSDCLTEIASVIAIKQSSDSEPLTEKTKQSLALAQAELKEAESSLPQLNKFLESDFSTKNRISLQTAILYSGVLSSIQNITNLKKYIVEQNLLLLPPATQPAMLIGSPYVAINPISPNPVAVIAIFLVFCMVIGCLIPYVLRHVTCLIARHRLHK